MEQVDGERTHLLGGSRANTITSYNNSSSASSTFVHHQQHQQQKHNPKKLMPSLSSSSLLDDQLGGDINLLVSPRSQWYSAVPGQHAVAFDTASPLELNETTFAEPLYTEPASIMNVDCFTKLPGLLIALLLNLFLSISFGQAFFPTGILCITLQKYLNRYVILKHGLLYCLQNGTFLLRCRERWEFKCFYSLLLFVIW